MPDDERPLEVIMMDFANILAKRSTKAIMATLIFNTLRVDRHLPEDEAMDLAVRQAEELFKRVD